MASARLNKYVVDALSADALESVPSPAADAADAVTLSFSDAAAASAASAAVSSFSSSSAAATGKNAFYPVSSLGLERPEGLLPPQTGFHCLEEKDDDDVHFHYRYSNQIEVQAKQENEDLAAEEEFDLEFQVRVVGPTKRGDGRIILSLLIRLSLSRERV